jgi:hypothetical protein
MTAPHRTAPRMKMESLRSALRYSWLTCRREPLWFPLAFLALFAVATLLLGRPAVRLSLARGYLGFIVPLVGGILAAYAVLDDPALELRFSTPVSPAGTLLGRVGWGLLFEAACAFGFQVFAWTLQIDLGPLGGFLAVQRIWLVPTLALAALGIAGSLAGAQNVVGASLVGTVWLVELLMKGWFQANARYGFLFLGVFVPGDPALALNQAALLASALVLFTLSWMLLHRPERFL